MENGSPTISSSATAAAWATGDRRGPSLDQQLDGGHLASEAQNKIALGICLVGNFDERRPTSGKWTVCEPWWRR